jgi:hypothetical protein
MLRLGWDPVIEALTIIIALNRTAWRGGMR